jgi:hypothetical protein
MCVVGDDGAVIDRFDIAHDASQAHTRAATEEP